MLQVRSAVLLHIAVASAKVAYIPILVFTQKELVQLILVVPGTASQVTGGTATGPEIPDTLAM